MINDIISLACLVKLLSLNNLILNLELIIFK